MSLSKSLLAVFVLAFIWGGFLNWERRKELAQPLSPSLSPGFICDQVAAKTKSKATVGWYHACIEYAGEVQRRHTSEAQGTGETISSIGRTG